MCFVLTLKNIDQYLNKKNLSFFLKEDQDVREWVLDALNRKPFHKKLKNGMDAIAKYNYIEGFLALDFKLLKENKVIWKSHYLSESIELSLDGEESKTFIFNIFLETLLNEISTSDEKGIHLLKKLLF